MTTEQKFKIALKEMMQTKPLSDINVTTLCDKLHLHRQTFYYHYQDIYDLLQATLSTVMEKALSENITTWRESLMNVTRFAMENRRAVYHIYNSANRDQLERYLNRVAGQRMERLIRYLTQGVPVKDEDVGLLALFYKHAIVGTLMEWLANDMKADVERVLDRMAVLLEGNLKLSLERIGAE